MKTLKILRNLLFTILSIVPFYSNAQWSGTGFALRDKYIATNYHVINGADKITIIGNESEYTAEVFASDPINDLAILKINDTEFTGFTNIPYCLKTNISDVGENVFALGYPLIETMGNSIKLSTGIISSQLGFQNEESLYQISVPIQPGNSGGPLFDYEGNLIGIICAKHLGTENVGYAVKASYLSALANSISANDIIPLCYNTEKTFWSSIVSFLKHFFSSTPKLSDRVKELEQYVFLIKCNQNRYSRKSYTSNKNTPNGYIKPNKPHSAPKTDTDALILANPPKSHCIHYTSIDNKIINPKIRNILGSIIISNKYENGKGIIICKKPITKIGASAFASCSTLASIIIPESVTSIGSSAFRNCSSLTSISIPDNVKDIGDGAFELCENLVDVKIGKKVSLLSSFLFNYCKKLENITINGDITEIGTCAFDNCKSLKSITIPNKVTKIGYAAFHMCSSLGTVNFGKSVKEIESMAFFGCKSLAKITIPNNVIKIGTSAFGDCSSLTKIYCQGLTPPTLSGDIFSRSMTTIKIYVPTISIEDYKSAEHWQKYARWNLIIEYNL